MVMRPTQTTNTPLAARSPPDNVPTVPPVVTRAQQLPFGELTWENFERLCYRLTRLDGDVEHCARYGRQGDAQEGIDIFARQLDGHYYCLQAKRHRSFGPAKLRDAVETFLDGSWASRTARFTIAVQASLRSIDVQEEIERQAVRLKDLGISFAALDAEELSARLRDQPAMVDDFFGRAWVVAFLGQQVADNLGTRLDGAEFARVRAQLAGVYQAQFHFVDPGSFGSINDEAGRPALSLLDRFLKPDMLMREATPSLQRVNLIEPEGKRNNSSAIELSLNAVSESTQRGNTVTGGRLRRLSLDEWLSDGHRLVLLGDAGCGKSTLLRVITLDLLGNQQHFSELAARWGEHLPLYISFSRWSSLVAREGSQIGIKEIVRRSLQPLLTGSIVDLLDRAIDEQRVLLLIDGLDEWSNEQAARVTLSTLVTIAEAHDVPAVVSGRPRGLDRVGTLPANWKRGTIAPLSNVQQSNIAGRWFERYATVVTGDEQPSEAGARANRFMAELARDPNLGALATVPLLLVGLVTLALRGQILPRTRGDIYDQLVRTLLEVHPERRATASGDTEARFCHAADPSQRRAAIARLAFSVRDQTGGGAISIAIAREEIRAYLASPQGLSLSEANAMAATTEILSINAETQGLVIENAPGEIRFVHASFEEFLCAEYIYSWPFNEIEEFVRLHSGESRWRNVITNLLSRIHRRDEFDRLIAIIETPVSDEVARFHRDFLLGDIAFSAAIHSAATARRLALLTMERVEADAWLPARREALASVLKGLSDPAIKADIEKRLSSWLPARMTYRASLIEALGSWQPSIPLQELLLRAMRDEDRAVQRAAAAAFSRVFSPSSEACEKLLEGMSKTNDLATAAALLESLIIGWADVPEALPMFEEAWDSHGADLRLVGILGLAETGIASDEARDAVLGAQSMWSDISYPYRDLAATMLMRHWPDDETLVKGALRRASKNFDSIWELDVATSYLLESSTENAEVRNWILAELDGEFPFNVMADQRIWSQVGRFASADPKIRVAANAYWCKPKSHLIGLHKIVGYVAQIADRPVADALIDGLHNRDNGFGRHWALNALIYGWGRDNPEVKAAIDALVYMADEDLYDLAAFLPIIIPDRAVARERLIRMSRSPHLRRDLLATALETCGCDGRDHDAVAAILLFPDKLRGLFDPSYSLFRAFSEHPDVRALALKRAEEGNGPYAAIAVAYADAPEFAKILFDAAVPLPVDLRTQIVEVASAGAPGTALENVLGQSMLETDPELRASMVIAHHRAIQPEARDAAQQALLAKMVAVGSDFESVRAAALAGLTAIGALDALVMLEERGNPIALQTGGLVNSISSVERLICERFAEFEIVFGDSLPARFESFGRNGRLASILSTAPSASPAARTAFLALADRGEIPLTPRALRALASERPRSELLLARCWDLLESDDHRNDRAMVCAEVGLVLRDNFSDNQGVRHRLIERFKRLRVTATAIPLAIFAPDAQEISEFIDIDTIGRSFGDWTVAVHVAAFHADSVSFCKLLEAMISRRNRSQFDAQLITNLAVDERLQRDPELASLMGTRIVKDIDASISGSFARYLAVAGKLSPEPRDRILDALRTFGINQRLPVAGYDAIADQWRAIRATLLDAVFAEFEFS